MSSRTGVVVVGAGPTGLALACGLSAGGVPVRVLDKATGPARTSRALGLQPRGAEVLDRLGALGDLPDRSIGIGQVAVHINGRHIASLRVGQRTKLVTRAGLLVSQAEIEAALRHRLAELGGHVEWGADVVSAEQDPHGGTVVLGGGATVHADWIVGCDGAHSRVRKAAGIGFPGVPLVERFLLADVHADLPIPRDTVSVWLRGADLLGAFPLPGEDLWRLMAPVPAGGADEETVQLLARMLAQRSGLAASSIGVAEWASGFGFHRRLAETYRRGRLLLAGDAAHIHSPFGGQGMNTGLGDAENLAWKLALVCAGRAQPTLLDTYQAERRPIATEVLASTSGMTRLILGDTALLRLMRDHAFVPLLNRPWIQRLIWEHASQLKVNYRRGPLARWTFTTGPRPGDRVPDLACRHADGRPTRLHAELGSRWALLVPDALDACVPVARKHLGEHAVTVLIPSRGRVHQPMLVRPDAHLGRRGAPIALDRWLAGILGR
ncbi:MAG: FAD-dependent monooxygenase [Pseudonocardiaceae bacterium]